MVLNGAMENEELALMPVDGYETATSGDYDLDGSPLPAFIFGDDYEDDYDYDDDEDDEEDESIDDEDEEDDDYDEDEEDDDDWDDFDE